jgi:hypothetical protein
VAAARYVARAHRIERSSRWIFTSVERVLNSPWQ